MTQKDNKFEEIILERRMVTRVTKWGRRMSFRAVVLVWNKAWKIWIWVWKWQDVVSAVKKATNEAYKNVVDVPVVWEASTVPYARTFKYKSAIVKILPAAPGTGIKAGSSIRRVLELAWYQNILSKRVWTSNVLNNALATIKLLQTYKVKR